MLAECVFSVAHEGPPGRVHGGWVAAVLDHAVGRAVAAAGFPGMTASLTVNLNKGALRLKFHSCAIFAAVRGQARLGRVGN